MTERIEIPGWHYQSPVRLGTEHIVVERTDDEGSIRYEPYVRDA